MSGNELSRLFHVWLLRTTIVSALVVIVLLHGLSDAVAEDVYAAWNFDEGSGLTAWAGGNGGAPITLYGNATWAAKGTGPNGDASAVVLNGTTAYARSSVGGELSTDGDLTVALWVKIPKQQNHLPGGTATDNDIVSKWYPAATYPYVIRLINRRDPANAGKVIAASYDGTSGPSVMSKIAINDNQWHHIAFVRDTTNKTLLLYIDGNPPNSTTYTTLGNTSNASQLYVGDRGNTDHFLTGSVDRLQYWNRALTAGEVAALMGYNLEAAWAFNEGSGTTAAATGNGGATATLHNATWAASGDGATGDKSALVLDGTNAYAEIPAGDLSTNGDLTVALWVKVPPTQKTDANADTEIVSKWNPAETYPYEIRLLNQKAGMDAGRIKAIIYDTAKNNPAVTSSRTINDGRWHHVAFVRDAVNKKLLLYIDGALDASADDTTTGATSNTSPVFLGARAGASNFFTGQLDQFTYWSHALSAPEVAALARGGKQTTACDTSVDTCQGAYSRLVAIAHDHEDYANTLLYRVKISERPTTTNWGDGINGFFYRASTDKGSTWKSYLPFNGVGVNADGNPTLRPFSFIVKVPVGGSQLIVEACASNAKSDSGGNAACTETLWTEAYTTLPQPSTETPSFVDHIDLDTLSSNVTLRNNGVYGALITIQVTGTTLTGDQVEWLYDHLVFLNIDDNNHYNVYLNDILEDESLPSLGVLNIEEAAPPTTPGGTSYQVKYGSTSTVSKVDAPKRQFWLYSTDTQYVGTDAGFQAAFSLLYDDGADCWGFLLDVGSVDTNCEDDTTAGSEDRTQASDPGSVLQSLKVKVLKGSDVQAQGGADVTAGSSYVRTVTLDVGGSHEMCSTPVNPLAVNSSASINLPNYVINRTTATGKWAADFPPALYYVSPTGFGNCDISANTPFCENTPDYVAYTPAYRDANKQGGSLNGSSTENALIGSFEVVDQYQLSGLADAGGNSLLWFDNCGYGHFYTEPKDTLGNRLSVPPPHMPGGLPTFQYTITNNLDEPVVFFKECCASFYISEDDDLVPPQQIGGNVNNTDTSGSGLFVASGQKVTYETIFSDELMKVYRAATGTPLFDLRLMAARSTVIGAGNPAVFDCEGANGSVLVSGSGDAWDVTIGGPATGGLDCTASPVFGACPWPMDAGQGTGKLAGYTTCTLNANQKSAFILDVDGWAAQVLTDDQPVWLMAWGASGDSGANKSINLGGTGGAGGFALTLVKGSDLKTTETLYGYIGYRPTGYSADGGSSSILAKVPLTSTTKDNRTNTTPPPKTYVYLIAGGAGGGGASSPGLTTNDNGGNGGSGSAACANASTVPGAATSTAGATGTKVIDMHNNEHCTPGGGGNSDGKGAGGGGGSGGGVGTTGIGGFAGGYGWVANGSIVPSGTPLGTGDGPGTRNYGGGGGGGYGGGGGGESCNNSHHAGAGGGGGGSFAAGNTAYDANAPTRTACTAPDSPAIPASFPHGAIQFAYKPAPKPTGTQAEGGQ